MALAGNLAAIFNNGCDARFMGLPEEENPYDSGDAVQATAYMSWRSGWDHVNRAWGVDVRGRWPVTTLPQVEGMNGRQ